MIDPFVHLMASDPSAQTVNPNSCSHPEVLGCRLHHFASSDPAFYLILMGPQRAVWTAASLLDSAAQVQKYVKSRLVWLFLEV